MYDSSAKSEDLLLYQSQRLKDLVGEIVQCCEDRKFYESFKYSLPYAELRCLLLFDGQRYLTVKDISQRLDVAKSRVTKLIDGLIGRGLVERIDDPKDARIRLISLTPEGLRKSEEIDAFQREIHQKILRHLGEEERKTVLSNLDLLRSGMEAVKAELA